MKAVNMLALILAIGALMQGCGTPIVLHAQQRIIFEDNFGNNENNWGILRSSQAVSVVNDGKYHFGMKLKKGWWNTYKRIAIDEEKDFQIEAVIQKVKGSDNYGYGIEWGRKDDQNLYYFLISGDGHYCYGKRINNQWHDIIRWPYSNHVNKADSINKLTLQKNGQQLQFFINDQHVNSTKYESFFGDDIGFILTGQIDIAIDRLIVRQTQDEPPSLSGNTRTKSPFTLHHTRQYHVIHEVTLTPSNHNTFSRIVVDLPLPTGSQHQEVRDNMTVTLQPIINMPLNIMSKNPYFEVIQTKPFDSPLLHIELMQPKTEEQWNIRLEYTVDVSNVSFDQQALQRVKISELNSLDRSVLPYLQPETLIESQSQEIQAALRNIFPDAINKNEDTVYNVARQIYKWVLNQSRYQLNSERGRRSTVWGALDLLTTKKGECGDYTALFVALCRAANIPAKAQVGFWTEGRNPAHVWAEFYIPTIGWVPVDPSMGDGGNSEQYFGQIRDLNKRIVVTEAFEHRYKTHRIDFLQTFWYGYWYNKSPVVLHATHNFITK